MHIKEIATTLDNMRMNLASEIVILSRNCKAAEQMERLYEIWYELDVATKDLQTLIRRSEYPCHLQQQPGGSSSSARGAMRNN